MEGDNKEAPLKNRKKMVQSRYAKDGLPHSKPTRPSRGWPRPPQAGLRLAIQPKQNYSRLRCLLCFKGFVIFGLAWQFSSVQSKYDKGRFKVTWLLTCSSNITLSLASYAGSALKRELDFCNDYLSLLYFLVY